MTSVPPVVSASPVGALPDTAPDSAYLQLGDVRLHVERWGGGPRRLLLMHGLGGNTITWHGVAPHLAAALGARVVAVDFPGFGASTTSGKRISLTLLADLAEALMRQLGPRERWWLAGNSLGGLVALQIAAKAPERVERVTLAALALPLTWGRGRVGLAQLRGYVPLAAPGVGRRLVSRYVRSTGLPGVVDDPVRLLFSDPSRLDAELRTRLLAVSRYRMTWVEEAARAYEQATGSLGWRLCVPGWLERLVAAARCPVQSIYGGRDPLYPLPAWERLQRLCPDWTHVCLEDVGHVPQLETPARFLEPMLDAHWLR